MRAAQRRENRAYRTRERYTRRAAFIFGIARVPEPSPWQLAWLAQVLWEVGSSHKLTIRRRRSIRRLTSARKKPQA